MQLDIGGYAWEFLKKSPPIAIGLLQAIITSRNWLAIWLANQQHIYYYHNQKTKHYVTIAIYGYIAIMWYIQLVITREAYNAASLHVSL